MSILQTLGAALARLLHADQQARQLQNASTDQLPCWNDVINLHAILLSQYFSMKLLRQRM